MKVQKVGCYHCERIFAKGAIKEYEGETPLCPFCGIDAVLDGVNCKKVLRRYNRKMFGVKV